MSFQRSVQSLGRSCAPARARNQESADADSTVRRAVAMKLMHKLDANDAAMLKRCATTIIRQVAAMKRMVDDFREYARMPTPALQNLQLNDLVTEVLTLYGAGE